jgi:hypothetical protein
MDRRVVGGRQVHECARRVVVDGLDDGSSTDEVHGGVRARLVVTIRTWPFGLEPAAETETTPNVTVRASATAIVVSTRGTRLDKLNLPRRTDAVSTGRLHRMCAARSS